MRSDLNKELEVLLRRAGEGYPSPVAGPHLDADTISAFAADAVPATARPNYVMHLADCDRCRTILADIISNREEEDRTPVRALPLPAAPWYSRLFNLPKTLYVTAMLILLFGGIAVLLVSQNLKRDVSEISKNIEPAPPLTAEQRPATTQETPPAVPAESDWERAAQSAPAPINSPRLIDKPAPIVSDSAPQPLAAPAPPPQASVSAANAVAEKDEATGDSDAGKAARVAPMPAPKLRKAAPETEVTVSGKTFKVINGVTIDSAYQGQVTTKVKRGSDDFRKLDDGLRAIANSVSGPVIILWKGRAYRID